MPVAFVRFLVRGIYGAGFWRVVSLEALFLEGEERGNNSVPCAIGISWRAGVASLEYLMAGCLRSRRLTVASVGAGRSCGGFPPRPLPRQGGGLGARDSLPGGGRLGRRGGGRPLLHSGGSSSVYLVLLCALFSGMRSRMGWALLSSKVSPSDLAGALLPSSSSFWRCEVTRICTPPVGTQFREEVLDCAHTRDPVARVVVAEGLLDFRAFFELWVRFGLGRCWWREG